MSEHDVKIEAFVNDEADFQRRVGSVRSILRASWHLLREDSAPFATELEDVEGQV